MTEIEIWEIFCTRCFGFYLGVVVFLLLFFLGGVYLVLFILFFIFGFIYFIFILLSLNRSISHLELE